MEGYEEHDNRADDGEIQAHQNYNNSANVSPLSDDDDDDQPRLPPSADLPSPSPPPPSDIYAGVATSGGAPDRATPDADGRAGESAHNPVVLDGDSPVQVRGQTQPDAARAPISGGQDTASAASGPSAAPARVLLTPLPRWTSGRDGAPELVLPRWQPDIEVTYCPICKTQFSIFIRKHHCRKCGRVVCNSCSPHRITIPYQYIVQPPGTPRIVSSSPFREFGVGGGERVRLCNPCVPDPNTAPPQTQGNHARTQSNLIPPFQGFQGPRSQNPNRWSPYFGPGPANDAQSRSRSVTMQSGAPSSSRPPTNPYRPHNLENQILSGTPPGYYRPSGPAPRQPPYPGMGTRYRSMIDMGERPDGPSTIAGPSSSSSAVNNNRRLPPLPPQPPQIAEEDECPVCHRELPPRTLPNFETLREAHINICITAHSTYGGTPSASAGTPGTPGTGSGDHPGSPPLPPMPPRRTGMFPYVATEKDCVDSAECTICLEEFEVGVPMARLECLCRFHRLCISAWWERHPGRCPMHQHDSFGY
ncbi:FYVE zinc finger-domain-containing protein [Bombardia bombarda]|uniref:RING-type E3 ubiquitin transferase n=1 Tax=Bombardia bombarda TaxID=252184 RepID=A0AA39X9V7_9PEZI|nr:FYVE zinc finger-domain-containing protein [Bombardia bombarda]